MYNRYRYVIIDLKFSSVGEKMLENRRPQGGGVGLTRYSVTGYENKHLDLYSTHSQPCVKVLHMQATQRQS